MIDQLERRSVTVRRLRPRVLVVVVDHIDQGAVCIEQLDELAATAEASSVLAAEEDATAVERGEGRQVLREHHVVVRQDHRAEGRGQVGCRDLPPRDVDGRGVRVVQLDELDAAVGRVVVDFVDDDVRGRGLRRWKQTERDGLLDLVTETVDVVEEPVHVDGAIPLGLLQRDQVGMGGQHVVVQVLGKTCEQQLVRESAQAAEVHLAKWW